MKKTIYNIISFRKIEDTDVKFYLEALAECGTTITVCNLSDNLFDIIVEGPNENRKYSGGIGSPAEETYNAYIAGYELFMSQR